MPKRRAVAPPPLVSGTVYAKSDALRLLKLRPRTERELRERLTRKGHPPSVIDGLLQELKAKRLVDDARFFGLTAAGAQGTPAQGASGNLRAVPAPSVGIGHWESQLAEARTLGAREALRMKGASAETRVRRLAGFLSRRGFEEEVVEQVVQEVVPHEGG